MLYTYTYIHTYTNARDYMGFFKKLMQKRKIKRDIDILRLKNERDKLRGQISRGKALNVSKNTKLFRQTLEDIEDIQDITGDNKNALLELAESDSGKKVINSLITKFGGGKQAAESVIDIVKTLTPEQKKDLMDTLIGAGKK